MFVQVLLFSGGYKCVKNSLILPTTSNACNPPIPPVNVYSYHCRDVIRLKFALLGKQLSGNIVILLPMQSGRIFTNDYTIHYYPDIYSAWSR